MDMKVKKLGIIGCGAIGNDIAEAVDKGNINVVLHACFDTDRKKFDALALKLKNIKPAYMEAEKLMTSS